MEKVRLWGKFVLPVIIRILDMKRDIPSQKPLGLTTKSTNETPKSVSSKTCFL